MNYNVLTIRPFDRQFKRLAKKYPSLKSELSRLISELKIKPDAGVAIGNDCYKIRLAITSKGKGKSGGAGVITYLTIAEGAVFLLSVYDKSEQADITDKDLIRLLKIVR